jgi:hypothetical protein
VHRFEQGEPRFVGEPGASVRSDIGGFGVAVEPAEQRNMIEADRRVVGGPLGRISIVPGPVFLPRAELELGEEAKPFEPLRGLGDDLLGELARLPDFARDVERLRLSEPQVGFGRGEGQRALEPGGGGVLAAFDRHPGAAVGGARMARIEREAQVVPSRRLGWPSVRTFGGGPRRAIAGGFAALLLDRHQHLGRLAVAAEREQRNRAVDRVFEFAGDQPAGSLEEPKRAGRIAGADRQVARAVRELSVAGMGRDRFGHRPPRSVDIARALGGEGDAPVLLRRGPAHRSRNQPVIA